MQLLIKINILPTFKYFLESTNLISFNNLLTQLLNLHKSLMRKIKSFIKICKHFLELINWTHTTNKKCKKLNKFKNHILQK